MQLDERLNSFDIHFPASWIDLSEENPDGPPTFIDGAIEDSGVLQKTSAQYISGEIPDPGFEGLIAVSRDTGLRHSFGEVLQEKSGPCSYGIYGFVLFTRPDFPYIAVWHLSDGYSFVFSTFICAAPPAETHIADVAAILTSLQLRS